MTHSHGVLELSDVAYDYGDTRVLEVARLDLSPGRIGLVGVNGAGKSTLIRVLAGALAPARGSVTVDGTALYGPRRNEVLGRVGYMPQEFGLPRYLRVAETLEYIGWMRGLDKTGQRVRASATLDQVGLLDRARSRVSTLSGGMLRRLTLAQALLTEPDLLLLDEPTTGLDPEQRAAVRALVEDLPVATVLMSSHVMEDIEQLTQRVLVLHDGRFVHDGGNQEFVETFGGPERSAELAFLTVLARARAS